MGRANDPDIPASPHTHALPAAHARHTTQPLCALFAARSAVEVVCREGPSRVLELVDFGAQFTRNKDGSLHLTKEGGHNNRRIVHAADLTGAEIERALLDVAYSHKNITFFEHHLATDLVVDDYMGMPHCFGADVLDQRSNQMCRCAVRAGAAAAAGAIYWLAGADSFGRAHAPA